MIGSLSAFFLLKYNLHIFLQYVDNLLSFHYLHEITLVSLFFEPFESPTQDNSNEIILFYKYALIESVDSELLSEQATIPTEISDVPKYCYARKLLFLILILRSIISNFLFIYR